MSVTAADEGVFRHTTTGVTNTTASSCTGAELSLKVENAFSKMDLSFIMLSETEHRGEGLSGSNVTRQSSPLSSPESCPTSPDWLLLEGHSVQGHEKTLVPEFHPSFTNPSEQENLHIRPAVTSFVPQTLRLYKDARHKPPEGLFGLLIPPKTPAQTRPRRQHTAKASRFFPKPPSASCIPFPPLDADSFGLVQERLCHQPFRLLIAVTFLNKTRGKVALPVCYQLFERYPTPEDLANAIPEELAALIGGLGLQNLRGKRMIKLAQMWVEKPPQKGQRYRRLHYPKKNDGKDIKFNESISDDDPRVGWEIAHLPGTGAYAIDSWRIFCRDELRGLPTGLPKNLSPETIEGELQKEWTRVLPLDKELRAYLRWRWLRIGWNWNPVTGERHQVEAELLDKLRGGGVTIEGDENYTVKAVDSAAHTFKLGFGSDKQCGGIPFLESSKDDIAAIPVTCGAVGGSLKALTTDGTVGGDPIADNQSGETDTIVVMNQESVATLQVDDPPKTESKFMPTVVSGGQHGTQEDSASETSPAIEAALSWLHCEDIEDTCDATHITGPAQQLVAVVQHTTERNPSGADYPWLPVHNGSSIPSSASGLEHVKALPESHNLPDGEMTGAQILRHRLRTVMREIPVAE